MIRKPILLILLCASTAAVAQPPSNPEIARMLQPQSEQFAFTASVRQAWGMRLNPASIGNMYSVNMMYNAYEEHGKLLEHEILFQNYLFNFSWRRALSSNMEYRVDHFSLGMGFGMPEFLVGGSFQWITSDLPEKNRGVLWTIGVLMKVNEYASIALTKRNMNQPIVGGVTDRGVQSVGAVVKPFKNSERLVLAFDWTLINSQRLKDGSFKIGIDGRVLRNLRLYALFDHQPETAQNLIMVGARLHLSYVAAGVNSAFDGLKKYAHSVASVLLSPDPNTLHY